MGTDPTIAELDVEFASRPDDSPLRCAFEPLSEKDLTQRLTKLAKPERTVFDAARGRLADAIAFQPCLCYSSQDRFVVQQIVGICRYKNGNSVVRQPISQGLHALTPRSPQAWR